MYVDKQAVINRIKLRADELPSNYCSYESGMKDAYENVIDDMSSDFADVEDLDTLLAEKDAEIQTLKDLISGKKGSEEYYTARESLYEARREIERIRSVLAGKDQDIKQLQQGMQDQRQEIERLHVEVHQQDEGLKFWQHQPKRTREKIRGLEEDNERLRSAHAYQTQVTVRQRAALEEIRDFPLLDKTDDTRHILRVVDAALSHQTEQPDTTSQADHDYWHSDVFQGRQPAPKGEDSNG